MDDKKTSYQKAILDGLKLKEVKDNPRIIYNNRMIIDAIKDSLPNNIANCETEFVEYFCGEEKTFGERQRSNIKLIYHYTNGANNPITLKKMMKYVNNREGTELSLETVGIKLDKEESKLDYINGLIAQIQISDQRLNFDDEIRKFLSELSDKVGENYFNFQLKLYRLYSNVYLKEANEINLAKAIENLINLKEFHQMFLKKELDDTKLKEKIDKLLMKLTVNYSYEIIKERFYGE